MGWAGRPRGASGWHREGLCAQQVQGSAPPPAAEVLPGFTCPASPLGWASGYETLPWTLPGLLGRRRNQALVGGSSHPNLESGVGFASHGPCVPGTDEPARLHTFGLSLNIITSVLVSATLHGVQGSPRRPGMELVAPCSGSAAS